MIAIIWIFFCLYDIGEYKSKINKENENELDYSENWVDKIKKKIFTCLNNNKTFDKNFTNTKNDKNLSGYFYDYKFGAGGLYLKIGLAGCLYKKLKIIFKIKTFHIFISTFHNQSILDREFNQHLNFNSTRK